VAVAELNPTKDRWLRAIAYGLLAEVATILTIIVIVMVYRFVIARGLSDAEYMAFGGRVGATVGPIGGTIYVFIFAQLLMRRIESHWIAHGILVAIGAIALSVAGSIAGHQGVPSGYIVASVLKLVAGAAAGFLASRRAVEIT